MSETWIRRFLYVIGAWNILGGATALVDPARHFAQMYGSELTMSDPLQAFFYRATWINVMAWGVGYVMAARHAGARIPVLLAGGLGKLAYAAACVALYRSGDGSGMLLATGILDVAFACVFAYALWGRRGELSSATTL